MEFVVESFRKKVDWFSYLVISAFFPSKTNVIDHSRKFLVIRNLRFDESLGYSHGKISDFETDLKPKMRSYYVDSKSTIINVPVTEYQSLVPKVLELSSRLVEVPETEDAAFNLLYRHDLTIVPEEVEIEFEGADIEDFINLLSDPKGRTIKFYRGNHAIIKFPNEKHTINTNTHEEKFYNMLVKTFSTNGVNVPDYVQFRAIVFNALQRIVPKSGSYQFDDRISLFYREYELNNYMVIVVPYMMIDNEKFEFIISTKTRDFDKMEYYGIGVVEKKFYNENEVRNVLSKMANAMLTVSTKMQFHFYVPYNGLYAAYTDISGMNRSNFREYRPSLRFDVFI